MTPDTGSCAGLLPSITWFLYIGLVGLIFGLLLARLVLYLDHHLQMLQARWWRRMYEEAALAQREQQKAIDAEIDEHLACSVCWEDRHPGKSYPFTGSRLCRDHARRRVLEKASSAQANQQQPINRLVNQTPAGEGVYA